MGFLSVGEEGPAGRARGLEWQLDHRRLNVAITRSRVKTFVVASPEFIELACGDENPSLASRSAWQHMREAALAWRRDQ